MLFSSKGIAVSRNVSGFQKPDAPRKGLVLKRNIGQSVYISYGDESLKITFEQRRGDSVQVVFQGPQSFLITREELLQ